jgi:hypothetical protein
MESYNVVLIVKLGEFNRKILIVVSMTYHLETYDAVYFELDIHVTKLSSISSFGG